MLVDRVDLLPGLCGRHRGGKACFVGYADSATGGECRSAAPPGMFPANMDVRARVRHKFVWRAPGTRLPMVLHDFGYKGFHITRRLPSNGGVVMKQLVLDS
jgi:hypothetical protein